MKKQLYWLVVGLTVLAFAAPNANAQRKKKTPAQPILTIEEFNQLKEKVGTLSTQTEAQKQEIAGLKTKLEEVSAKAEEKGASEEKIQNLEGKFEGLETDFLTTKADVDKVKKLSVSGYIQARYEWQWPSRTGTTAITPVEPWFTGTAVPSSQRNQDNFYIRRGRVKFTYTAGPTSRYVLYFDGSKNTVSMKEAYVELTEPWTKHNLSLLFGQFNWPFGFEIERSSSVREVPERSRAVRVLFPGERDRGANLTIPVVDHNGFRVLINGGAFNGTGIDNSIFTWQDPTRRKDYIGRAKVQLPTFGPLHLDFGGSGYFGDFYVPATSAAYQVTGWTDTNRNGRWDTGEPYTTRYVAATPALVTTKERLGGDAQLYYTLSLPFCKSGALFFEGYQGKDYNSKYATQYGIVKDTLAHGVNNDFGVVNELGFYAMWVMNISSKLQFAARYDFWDPVSDADTLALSDKARQKTYAGALNYFWDDNVRITAALDVLFFSHRKDMVPPLSSSYTKDWDTRNHTATLQVQYKF